MAAAAPLTMRRIATAATALAASLVVALCIGFAAFVAAIHQPPSPAPHADGIVALTGGADRIETALHLLDTGRARTLLVSGVAQGAGLHELAHRAGLDAVGLADRVTLGRAATTTLGNALETSEWARDHGLHSLIIVTAAYHMPRAMLEMRRTMPDMTLYPCAVQPPLHRGELRLLAGEYVKLVAAWFGVSHLVHRPVLLLSREPVGNSVSG